MDIKQNQQVQSIKFLKRKQDWQQVEIKSLPQNNMNQIKKFKRRRVYTRFKDNILKITEMGSLSSRNQGVMVLLKQ